MIQPNTILHQRYQITRHISSGGMGAVYEAKDLKLGGSPVAVKQTLFQTDNTALRQAFEKEGYLLANLSHQALPQVKDYFIEGQGQFMIMELVTGQDLQELLSSTDKAFSTQEVISWADQLLDALDYLHSQQPPIIHRDIKPSNIKLTPRGRVMLLDFGLAKEAGNQSQLAAYTLNFASPEQITNKGTSTISDIYSMGATFYYLLTKTAPIDAVTRSVAMSTGQNDPLIPAHQLNSEVPIGLSTVIKHSMEVDPSKRISTANSLRKAINSSITKERNGFNDMANNDNNLGYSPTIVNTNANNSNANNISETSPTNKQGYSATEVQITQGSKISPTSVKVADEPSHHFVGNSANQTNQNNAFTPLPASNSQTNNIQKLFSNTALVVPIGIVLFLVIGGLIYFAVSKNKTVTSSNIVLGTFVEVKPGKFIMGGEKTEDEKPSHTVEITKGFEMGAYELTQSEWETIMGENPSLVKGKDLPVENVSWENVQEFINKLNSLDSKYSYRLPTEAEWEYVARAGNSSDTKDLDEVAWYADNSGKQKVDANEIFLKEQEKEKNKAKFMENATKQLVDNGCQIQPVGKKKANAWGLYDMQGNVWEWCQDWHGKYSKEQVSDPQGSDSGTMRVIRGGSVMSLKGNCNTTNRGKGKPNEHDGYSGFRLVRVAK